MKKNEDIVKKHKEELKEKYEHVIVIVSDGKSISCSMSGEKKIQRYMLDAAYNQCKPYVVFHSTKEGAV